MRKIILGRTNEKVSAISLGTWAFGGAGMSGKFSVGWGGQTDSDSKEALLAAWDNGINHWDTADVYGDGHSEKIIGSMWDEISRNNIFPFISPKPFIGFPQYFSFLNCFLFSLAIFFLKKTNLVHFLQLVIFLFKLII